MSTSLAFAWNILTSRVMPADTVSMLNRPEWPVAGLFLERFLLMLKSERGLGSSATAMRQVAFWRSVHEWSICGSNVWLGNYPVYGRECVAQAVSSRQFGAVFGVDGRHSSG